MTKTVLSRAGTSKQPIPHAYRLLAVLMTLALLLPQEAARARPAAAATTPAGLITIDPQDNRRLLMDGQPYYLAGYYPSIAAITHDQIDYQNYYKNLINKLSAHRINYMRTVFDMGQAYGGSMTLYQRTGPGTAADGKLKFDLTKFNQGYFDYWRNVITYARSKGIVVQLVLRDSWHNKSGIVYNGGSPDKNWGMQNDYFAGANNINGLDASNRADWHSPSHASFNYHKEVIRRVVDNLGDLPNIVYEISNENYTNSSWEMQLADFLTSYEASKGRARHLVIPRDLPNHDGAGGKTVDPVRAHSELVSNHGKNKPLIADNDGGGSSDPVSRRTKAWGALTAGAHMSYFHIDLRKQSELDSQDATDGMRYVGLTTRFLDDFKVDLRGMKPSDNLATNAWAYAKANERFIIYLRTGGSTTVSNLPSSYTAHWFDPRSGASQPASGGPTFAAPDGKDWVLYINKSATPPPASPTPTTAPPKPTKTPAPTNTPPPQPTNTRVPTNTPPPAPTNTPPPQPTNPPAPTNTPPPTPTSAPPEPTSTQPPSPPKPTQDPQPPIAVQFHVRINFQPDGSPPVEGVLVDSGKPFRTHGNGYTYGWNKDNGFNTRERNADHSPDDLHDTLIQMQVNGNFIWEIAVPNGEYRVSLVAGDPHFYDGFYKVKVEGITVVSGAPDPDNLWIRGSMNVKVTDGFLTVRSSSDAVNTKLNYIDIRTAGPSGNSLFLPSLIRP